MNNEEYIDILNGILVKMDVKGYCFSMYQEKIYLYLLTTDDNVLPPYYTIFGTWTNIEELFDPEHILGIGYMVEQLEWYENGYFINFNSLHINLGNNVDWRLIHLVNDMGKSLLRIISRCSSWDEFMMKIQLMGY